MRRIRILGVCVVAVFAMTAVAATSAFATSVPTWYECAKASPKNTGNYTTSSCTTLSEPGKGGFELKAGVGKGKVFKGKSVTTEKVVIHVKGTQGDNTVECKSSADSGKAVAPNLESDVVVVYSKCEALKKVCTSPGAKPGEVKSSPLKGELGYIEEPTVKVGLKLQNESTPGGSVVEFTCEGLSVKVTGEVIGAASKDVNAISKESVITDTVGEFIGEVEFEGKKFSPLVNTIGFEDELAEIAAKEKPDQILKAEICGGLIEILLKKECTPQAPAGQASTVVNKGESLEIKA